MCINYLSDAAVSLDSDSSSSPSQLPVAAPNTPASVAAFVKKVKRIRFDSISVSKPDQTTMLCVKPLSRSRSTSCPDLTTNNSPAGREIDIDCPSTAARHVVVIGSPVTPTAVKLTGDMQVLLSILPGDIHVLLSNLLVICRI